MTEGKEQDWLDRFLQLQQSWRAEEIKGGVDELKASAAGLAEQMAREDALLRRLTSDTERTLEALQRAEAKERRLNDLKNLVFDIEHTIEGVASLKDAAVQYMFLRMQGDTLSRTLELATREMDTLSEKEYSSNVGKRLQDFRDGTVHFLDQAERQRCESLIRLKALKMTQSAKERGLGDLMAKRPDAESELENCVVELPPPPAQPGKSWRLVLAAGIATFLIVLAFITRSANGRMFSLAFAVVSIFFLVTKLADRRYLQQEIRAYPAKSRNIQAHRKECETRLDQIVKEISQCERELQEIDKECRTIGDIGDEVTRFIHDHPEYAKIRNAVGI
ncbi:MAG: hypothetical protein V1694_01530 [Candidatus Eisenbacteria bacterium]